MIRTTLMAAVGSVLLLIPVSCLAEESATAVEQPEEAPVITDAPATSNIKLSLDMGTGFLGGQSKEYVYWPFWDNHKASELDWSIDCLYLLGLEGRLEIASRFGLEIEGWFKVTDGEGDMSDYDWLYPGLDYTHLSKHPDTDVTDGSLLDLRGSYAFYKTFGVALTGLVGYKRDVFGWESRGGTYDYWRGLDTGVIPANLPVIAYEQTFESIYGGIGFAASFSGNIRLAGSLIYSPLVKGEAVDHHYLRNLVTYDDFTGGDMISFDISGGYDISSFLGVEVGFSYLSYDNMQGDSEWHFNDEGRIRLLEDGAGMDHSSAMLTIMLQMRF
ncbi:MAG: hypothetical protein CSA20_04245 [Deltaproteobacteria bacterium]|nr:MAG: hypothetical protein CSA20_04245 [Deltaproteobacteria bacterium]